MAQSKQRRMNFFISPSQFEAMEQITSPSKTPKSVFMRAAIDELINKINRQQQEERLEEGYKVMAEEHKQFAKLSAKAGAEVVPPWK